MSFVNYTNLLRCQLLALVNLILDMYNLGFHSRADCRRHGGTWNGLRGIAGILCPVMSAKITSKNSSRYQDGPL